MKENGDTKNNIRRILLIIAISALVLTGIAILVGILFEGDSTETVTVEEVVFLPYQNEKTVDAQTMSYGMAAVYSDGSIGNLPDEPSDMAVDLVLEEEVQVPERKRAVGDTYSFQYTGNDQNWEVPEAGTYLVEIWGAGGASNGGTHGGNGGAVTAEVELDDGTYTIVVGGHGAPSNSHRSGNGAGGFSGILLNGDHIISAGGGGGAGSHSGSGHGGNGGYPGEKGTDGPGGSGGNGGSIGDTPQGGAGGLGHSDNGDPGTAQGGGQGGSGGSSAGAGGGGGGYGTAAGASGGCYSCGGCAGAGGYGGGGGGGGGGCGGGPTRYSGAGGGGGGFRGGDGGRCYNYYAGYGGGGGGGGCNWADPDFCEEVQHTSGGGAAPMQSGKIEMEYLGGGQNSDYGMEYEEGTGETYEFTNCGRAGQYGPSQGQINNEYNGTNLQGQVTWVYNGIQRWTVPETNTYTITTLGAEGGFQNGQNNGGYGAKMKGDFYLEQGTVLKILVGQKGENGNGSGGGGGGSYVTLNNNDPLIISGGGGGGQWGQAIQSYQHGTVDQSGQSTNHVNGGTNGSGGQGDYGGGCCGGGGLTGNGGGGSYGSPGIAFVNGGNGGNTSYQSRGGFGGGGGTHGNSGGGGGGGGYSGGAGGYHNDTWGNGGGGGSYNDGDNQDNETGVNQGHGLVTIAVAPVPLARYYKETFTEPFLGEDASEFGVSWYDNSELESARNQRIVTEPERIEAANYTFTNCGSTGRYGPSQANVNSEYSGTNLDGNVTVGQQGYQEWIVPETATYTIKTYGAKGGSGSSKTGGKGAMMSGEFELIQGDKLIILVGQKGIDTQGSGCGCASGGGGTYVAIGNNYSSADPLIVAGAGGGASDYSGRDGNPGVTTEWGSNYAGTCCGGQNGNGGTGGNGGHGAGFFGDAGWSNYVYTVAKSYRNGGVGGDYSYNTDGGFGGGGASHTCCEPGAGGGYSGGSADWSGYRLAGGGGSYNDGANQDNQEGANNGHGMVEIIIYEDLDDPGFDAYDQEERGPYCWVMDNPDPVVRDTNLNEMVLHIGLDAGEEDVTDLTFEFATAVYGNCEILPPSLSNGDDMDYDGILVSTDGEDWYKLWSPVIAEENWTMHEGLDILAALPPNSVDPQEDLFMKFLQFGSGTFPDECIIWDEMTLRANPEVEFIFEVPSLDYQLTTDPEDPFRIYAEGQGDPDVATVTFSLDGIGGAVNPGMTRADPILYEFTTCGQTGRYGPSQAQVNNAYSGTTLDGAVTSNNGIQTWTVPDSGLYILETWGAKGGDANHQGGNGARMRGEFELEEGDTLKILIGQMGIGGGSGCSNACGGGGGTYVTYDDNTPLIIAGGGSGDDGASNGYDGRIEESGGQGESGAPGGTNGNGGEDANSYGCGSGGGGGLLTDGGSDGCYGHQRGFAFVNGGTGGSSSYGGRYGGFGGGAGTHRNNTGGGAGGGYSGGGAPRHGCNYAGGGGGSYNAGENPDNEAGANSDHGKVEISYIGGGDPAATEVRFLYERADGIVVNDDPFITEIAWSSLDEYPDDDAVFISDEFEIEFTISNPQGFAGEIGTFSLQYITWDNEVVDIELESPYLRIQEFSYAEFSEDSMFIANNYGQVPGGENLITLVAYDDLEPSGEMPPQQYHGWQVDLPTVDSFQLIDTPSSHQKYLHITGGEPGDTGMITVTHGPGRGTGDTFELPITLTSGPATTADVTTMDPYMYSMTDILTVAVQDDYGNEAVDWTGKMYISLLAGEVEFSEEVEIEGDGGAYDGWLYYEFTPADRALHTFFITPWTYMGDGDTIIHFETVTGINADVSLTVDAGPVSDLVVTPDWDEMGVLPRNPAYIYAGETLYLDVQAVDMGNHVSTSYNAPIIIGHNSDGTGTLEPEPWFTEESNVIMEMVDGDITAQDQLTEFIFYKATGDLDITVKSGINHAIAGKLDLEVRAGPLAELTPIPDPAVMDALHAADGRMLIPVSGTQTFDVLGYDEWGNPVMDLSITEWDVDEPLGMMDDDEFQAVDYFSLKDGPGIEPGEYSYLDGFVYITAEDDDEYLEGEVILNVPIRVFNRLNVWIVEEEIGATEFLLDTPFELRVPVHYKTPANSFPDNLQLLVKCTIYHEVNVQGIEQGTGHVIHTSGAPNGTFRLLNLIGEKDGIKEYSVLIPYEGMASALNYDMENGNTLNYLKVEILDVPGGADMGDFQWNEEDDSALTELHAVATPPASETPSFAPAMALMVLALLGGAVVANLYSTKGKKKGRKDEDGVSPVIAIILMVAITIVLAGVLWLWVSGLVDTQKSNDIEYVDTAWESLTLQNDYQLIIENVKDKEFSVEDLEFSLMDGNKVDKSMGQHKVTAIYGKSIDNETIVSFHDGDHDGYLSTGDRFIIKSEDHVNYDGSADPGEARAGYYFALKTKDNELFEVQIEQ